MGTGEDRSFRRTSSSLGASIYVHVAASILLVLAGSSFAQSPYQKVHERLKEVESAASKRHAWADEIAQSTDPARELSLLFRAVAPESTEGLDPSSIETFKATVNHIVFSGLRKEKKLGRWLRTILDASDCTLSERISVAGFARNNFRCTPDLLPSLIDSYLIDHQPEASSVGSFHEARVEELRREIRSVINVAGTQSIPFLERFTEALTRNGAVAKAAEKALATLAKNALKNPSDLPKKDRELVAKSFRRAAKQLEKTPKADESLVVIEEMLARLNPPSKIITMVAKYPKTAGTIVFAVILFVLSLLGWPWLLALENKLSPLIPRQMDSLAEITKAPFLFLSLIFWIPFSLGFGWDNCLKAWRKKNRGLLAERAYGLADVQDDQHPLGKELSDKVRNAITESKLDTVFECGDEHIFNATIKTLTDEHQLAPVYVPGNVLQAELITKIREELRSCPPNLSDTSVGKMIGKGMIFVAIGRATSKKKLSLKKSEAHVKIAVTLGRSVDSDRVISLDTR